MSSKVIAISADNFMKLNVEVVMDGNDVIVTGKNGLGKSTFLNLVWYALTGKDVPDEPIQIGKDVAIITATISRDDESDLIITRTFKRKGDDTLKVRTATGAKIDRSPQTFLNDVLGGISFDLEEFVTLQPAEQKKRLQKYMNIDTTDIDLRKKTTLAELSSFNTQAKALRNEIDEIEEDEKVYVERFVTEVAEKQEEISKYELDLQAKNASISNLVRDQNDLITKSTNESKVISDLEKWIVDMEAEIQKRRDKVIELKKKESENVIQLDELSEKHTLEVAGRDEFVKNKPNKDAVALIIKEIEENNIKFNNQELRKDKVVKLEQLTLRIVEYGEKADKIDQERVELLKSTPMPLPEMEFTDEGLIYQGLPINKDQHSTATIAQINFTMSLLLNPKLHLAKVKDWMLLDTEAKEVYRKIAKEHDIQLFMEQVTDSKEIGFTICES